MSKLDVSRELRGWALVVVVGVVGWGVCESAKWAERGSRHQEALAHGVLGFRPWAEEGARRSEIANGFLLGLRTAGMDESQLAQARDLLIVSDCPDCVGGQIATGPWKQVSDHVQQGVLRKCMRCGGTGELKGPPPAGATEGQ